MNLETKITMYKFTPQLFTLTLLRQNTMTAPQGISYRIVLTAAIPLLPMEVLKRIVLSVVGMELCMV